MYDRMELSLMLWLESRSLVDVNNSNLQSFEERFQDSSSVMQYGQTVPLPDITKMDREDLRTYAGLLASSIKGDDLAAERARILNVEMVAVMNGAKTDTELIQTIDAATRKPASDH